WCHGRFVRTDPIWAVTRRSVNWWSCAVRPLQGVCIPGERPRHTLSDPRNEGFLSMRTYTPKPGDITREWLVIDATDVVLGRLASQAATLLRGKHKPTFAPHVDTGDFVIIINA